MTSRLYFADSYLSVFNGAVVSIDGTRVYLDQTAFYPTSGGQPHDLGELGGVRVMDVVDEDTRIAHLLASPPAFTPGTVVGGVIDWTRRFDHMQQHTGQHLLSAVFDELFGSKTVSVHFGETSSSIDLDSEPPLREQVVAAERRANEIVFENRRIHADFADAATAIGLRKPSDREGEIRIVSIDGVDRSACGGTHVRRTSEIGQVSIRRVEKYKQGSRVEFLCGWRALRRSRADFDTLARMSAAMSTSIEELPVQVESLAGNLRLADADRRRMGDALARHRARELHAAAAPDARGARRVVEAGPSVDELRSVAQAMSGLPNVLFAGIVASPPTVIVAASNDSGVDAGAVLKAALAKHGGRGGGSPRVAQGTVPEAASLDAVVAAVIGGNRR